MFNAFQPLYMHPLYASYLFMAAQILLPLPEVGIGAAATYNMLIHNWYMCSTAHLCITDTEQLAHRNIVYIHINGNMILVYYNDNKRVSLLEVTNHIIKVFYQMFIKTNCIKDNTHMHLRYNYISWIIIVVLGESKKWNCCFSPVSWWCLSHCSSWFSIIKHFILLV